jgi:hypothetical protein
VAKALLTVLVVVGLIFPSAGACMQSGGAQFAMPCCAGASCAMDQQMREGSCCAKVQGEFSNASIAAPASSVGVFYLAGAVQQPVIVLARGPSRTFSCTYSPPSSAPPPHPLQI